MNKVVLRYCFNNNFEISQIYYVVQRYCFNSKLKKKEYFVSFIDFYIDFKGIFQNQKNTKNKDFVLLLIFASFLKAFSEIKIKQKTQFCVSHPSSCCCLRAFVKIKNLENPSGRKFAFEKRSTLDTVTQRCYCRGLVVERVSQTVQSSSAVTRSRGSCATVVSSNVSFVGERWFKQYS